jgi:hypothetical protein
MERRFSIAFVLAALACGPTPALATASFGCEINDASLKFSAEGALSRGFGAKLINFDAEAEVLIAEAPADFRKIGLQEKLIHSWVEGGELRLLFYHERTGNEPHATFELVVKTTMGEDEIEYLGTYDLTVFTMDPPNDKEGKTLSAEGKVACSMG